MVDGQIAVNTGHDSVWPINAWSIALAASLAPLPPAGSLLDVGTGTGWVAAAARARYQRVVGIDLNPRAIAYARLNAALTAPDDRGISFEVADCFAADHLGRFDHVGLAAPSGPALDASGPMVSYGGSLGHELALRFMAEAAPRLVAPGGICQVWAILAVLAEVGSVDALVAGALPPGTFDVEATPLRSGGLYLSPDSIASRVPPPMSSFGGDDKPGYLEKLARRGVVEVVPTSITLRRRG